MERRHCRPNFEFDRIRAIGRTKSPPLGGPDPMSIIAYMRVATPEQCVATSEMDASWAWKGADDRNG